jgi:NAD-dependent dihydropyrimidine dehydrogenase PreA subunit
MTPPKSSVVICQCREARVFPAPAAEAVFHSLKQGGLEPVLVEDLCAMAAKRDARLKEFAGSESLALVACFPRAVQWLFAAGGAPLPAQGCVFHNLREREPLEVARSIAGGSLDVAAEASGSFIPAAPAGIGKAEENAGAWFPVVDYDRCTHCMQCLSFCLFGVFGADSSGRIEVRAPENCKVNCPACSRVCPEVAIIFPKYASSPINGGVVGADAAEREQLKKVDISSLLGGNIYDALRERSRRRFSAERDPRQAWEERRHQLAKLLASGAIPEEMRRALAAELEKAMAPAGPETKERSGGL